MNVSDLFYNVAPLTLMCLVLSLIITIYIKNHHKKYNSNDLYSFIPSVWTSLGILGTFISIVISLSFNSIDFSNINSLISQISPAFLTSIVGVSGSIYWSISIKKEQAEIETSYENNYYKVSNGIMPEIILYKIYEGICQIVFNTSNLQKDMSSMFESSAVHIEKMHKNTEEHNKVILEKINSILCNLTEFFNDVSENTSRRIEELAKRHMDKVDSLMIEYKNTFAEYNNLLQECTANSIQQHKDALKGYHDGIIEDVKEEYEKSREDMSIIIGEMKKRIDIEDKMLTDTTQILIKHIASNEDKLLEGMKALTTSIEIAVKENVSKEFATLNDVSMAHWQEVVNQVTKLKTDIAHTEIRSSTDIYREFDSNMAKSLNSLSTALATEKQKMNEIEQLLVDAKKANVDLKSLIIKTEELSKSAIETSKNAVRGIDTTNGTLKQMAQLMSSIEQRLLTINQHKSVEVINGQKVCPNCNSKQDKDAKYCEQCGHSI